jgi:uncharacterized phage-associated protein
MLLLLQRFTKDQIEKIGNAIIYIAEQIPNLSKTKLLKLIYLVDEYSIKSYGIPFFDLEYKLWQAGPVNIDLFIELSPERVLLKDYIKLSFTETGECYINPKKKFDNSEFSENEIELLEEIVSVYKKYSAKQLVELCHRPSSLWYQVAKEKGVLELFETRRKNTTDFIIPLSDHIKDDKIKMSLYNEHKEFLDFSNRFKV